MNTRSMPGHVWMDSTFAFMKEGYPFIRNRCVAYGSPVFQTRLLGKRTLCLSGAEAATLFYDASRFARTATSTPAPLRNILLGTGGVQGLDGEAHAVRKQAFLDILSPARAEKLVELFETAWEKRISALPPGQVFEFLPWVERLLCDTVVEWAGMPALSAREADVLTRRLAAMIDGAGRVDPRMPLAWLRRKACERQAAHWITACREGRLSPPEGSALALLTQHRDHRAELLPAKVAAVELLNILRPVVAVGRFLLFGLIELNRYPAWRQRLRSDPPGARIFAEEVRRVYAFFPMVAAYVRETFEWHGYRFEKGTRAMFDLFGTNRDPALWKNAERFQPERLSGCPMAAAIVSQGSGEYTYHRCPGEPLTVMLMERVFLMLSQRMEWALDSADVDFSRLPMLPEKPVLMTHVKWL